ncbi:MAG: tRNA lysidine(34) synthetase TilS [Syntrophothermus sp.]
MVEQFLKFIHKENLFHSSDRILLAVSGGADSMLMAHLFVSTGFQVGVAHCNFSLRGEESDKEELFVSEYCDRHNIVFWSKRFNTSEIALQQGISIEMAARDLRYEWFHELMKQQDFNYLATAHHQDDVIETFVINLSRGSGIKGLSGIQPKSGRIIRPMLFTNHTEIVENCTRLSIDYCIDSSNLETIYKRNLIRHHVLPLLEKVNPAFRKNALKTIANLHETGQLFQQRILEIKSLVYSEDEQGVLIHIEKLQNYSPLRTILFELIRPFGFQAEQTDDIINSLNKESGRKFFSDSYRLVKDREYLIISPSHAFRENVFYIEENCPQIEFPIHLSIEKLQRTADYSFSTQPHIVDLDMDRLTFPLILRHWHEGEYFQPLGMTGLKKVSDFFIDEKYSIPEKENAWILASGDHLAWIVGKRMDDRFKIHKDTKNILRLKLQERA